MAKLPKKRTGKESSFCITACKEKGRIIKSELKKSTKNPKHQMIVLTFKVLEGENKGKQVLQWYNIVHTKEDVSNIAYEELDHIAFCCGLDGYKDTKEFHGIDLTLDISVAGKFNDVAVLPLEKKKKKKKGKKTPF